MKTVEQILTSKGYDNSEIDSLINWDGLDTKVREEFNVSEPIHLWEAYYIGDGDENILNDIAKSRGLEDYSELLKEMDYRLLELAEQIEDKK